MADENMREYEISWRHAGASCEAGYAPICEVEGVGWLVNVDRGPINVAFLCAEHGAVALERHERLNSKVAFVKGVLDDGFIELTIQWRFKS